MSSKVKRACKPSGSLLNCTVTVDCQALMMKWLPVTDVAVVSLHVCGFVASRAGDWYCSGCS